MVRRSMMRLAERYSLQEEEITRLRLLLLRARRQLMDSATVQDCALVRDIDAELEREDNE